MTRRILIVTYAFPPSNSIAVHRVLRLSKWLPHYGWEPTILTVETKRAHPYFYRHQHSDLDALIPDRTEVHRAKSFEWPAIDVLGKIQTRLLSSLAIPDLYLTWVPGAIAKARKLIEKKKIDVVLTTISPNSSALIGYFLRKNPSVRWVLDYRDPWCANPFKPLGGLRSFLEKKLEDRIVKRSDFNVTTSKLITKLYQDTYPEIAVKFATITNCYDPELQFVTRESQSSSRRSEKFRIIHAGSFYPKRNPTSFLRGLAALLAEHTELQNRIEVVFVGEVVESYRNEIARILGDTSVSCDVTGSVSYKESMRKIEDSDLLLAINGIEDSDNIFIPGKLFDYIAAGKPILLIGHNGAASEIVEQGNLGAVRAHHDFKGIGNDILKFYRQWEQGLSFEPDTRYVRKYHASNVAEQLARILNTVVRPDSAG